MITINYNDSRPIYEKVKDSLRQLMLSGALPPDSKLPPVRELPVSLTINPNTIQRAYRELEQEGYIVSVPGKGSFVSRNGGAREARRKELTEKLLALAAEFEAVGVTRTEMAALLTETVSGPWTGWISPRRRARSTGWWAPTARANPR